MISVKEALSFVKFTAEEDKALAKLEAATDASLFKFDGAPMRFEFQQEVSLKLAHALQRKYEQQGSWRVQVLQAGPGKTAAFAFTPLFMPEMTRAGQIKDLPRVSLLTSSVPMLTGQRLLVRMPTRGRPKQALEVLAQYREREKKVPLTIEVVIDEDDPTMINAQVLQRLNALGCVISVETNSSKVQAVNGGRMHDWDVLLLASDDMVPVVDNYASVALDAMGQWFPYLDGAVYFDDGYAHERCCTLPIIGRRFYEQMGGYVYEPEYQSLFCDQEQTELWTAMKRLQYVGVQIIEHRHWVTGAAKDATYQRNDALYNRDKDIYEDRAQRRQLGAQWGFESPPLWLSLCICTLPERRPQLDRLLDHLWAQILGKGACALNCTHPREVEILVDARPRDAVSIGAKRQALLERAQGHYVAFIDDDDWVAHDYVARILDALKSGADEGGMADCASISAMMTTAGQVPEPAEHSLKHREWEWKDTFHARSPNHLNPVRRELALEVGFPSKSHAEDFDYSRLLYPLLKREAYTGAEPLYFYWYQPQK